MKRGRSHSKLFHLLFIPIILFLFSQTTFAKVEPYKIGFVVAITGPASFLGEPQRKTAVMIQEWLNNAGGINGHPLELVIRDTKSDETQCILVAKELLEREKVLGIIGPSTSGESMAIVPMMEGAETPLISMATAKPIVEPVEERKWIFKAAWSDHHGVEIIYDHVKKNGLKKIGIITITTGFGDSGRVELKRIAPAYGFEIVRDERYGPKDTDMTTQMTKIKASGAEAVINWSVGPGLVITIRNWKDLDMKIPYYAMGFGSKRYIELAEGKAEGIMTPLGRLVVADKIPDKHPQKPVVMRYKMEYENRYKEDISAFGGHAWDAIYLMIDALAKVGPDKSKIRDYLENRKGFIGTSGIFNFSPKDHCGLDKTAYELITVKNGDWEIVK